jgi:uncharacterized protein
VSYSERAIVFACEGEELVGIVAAPEPASAHGVLIVVGGPQYRAGSHRQFTLLARALAHAGVPAMRYDYRGMGDASGDIHTFEEVQQDIRAGIDAFFRAVPAMKQVVIWGLCDAASAALFYASTDRRVAALALANPWVRTVEGEARAYVKHYYVGRLFQRGLWKKIARGEFDFTGSARSFLRLCAKALRAPKAAQPTPSPQQSLPERMRAGLERFSGPLLLIISGQDLTAQEFLDVVKASEPWRNLLAAPRVRRHDLPQANHTFSRREWRDEVSQVTLAWLRSLPNSN